MIIRVYSLMIIFSLLSSFFYTGLKHTQPNTDVNQDVMVVFLKITDPDCSSADSCLPDFPQILRDEIQMPRYAASHYETMLNYTIKNYIREATFSNAILNFEAISNPYSADGWFDAPHPLEDYNESVNASMGRDAYNHAFSVIGNSVSNYDVIMVVTNIQFHFGYTTGMDGYPLVVVGENVDPTSFYEVVGHEFGHVLTLEHVHMGPYDLVGNSDVLVHYGGWSKAYAGWVPEVTDMPCIGGQCEITTVLDPLERAGNNVLRIPFANLPGNNFVGYFVECRAKIGYDNNIPEEGVIITKIDTVTDPKMAAQLVYPSGDNNDTNAALSPGESFVDKPQGITITYLSKDGTNRCSVKATRGEIVAPDPLIYSGSEEVNEAGYTTYGSRDIWIDSQKNGWDVYPADTEFILAGDHIAVVGYGDPFWAEHENRIKFLIRNYGYSEAENVLVDIFVTQPIMLYIPGITCDGPELNTATLLSTIVIDHMDKGEVYFGEVPWTPTSNSAAQMTIVIRDYVGEVTHANNTASETYARQNILAESISESISESSALELSALFDWPLNVPIQTNPRCLERKPYRFVRRVISAIDKKYWVMNPENFEGLLTPGEVIEIPLASVPSDNSVPGDCENIELELQAWYDDVFVPVTGMTFKSCVVEPTKLVCKPPDKPVETGTAVTVSGNLTPANGDETLAIEYTSPGGDQMIQHVNIGKNGDYTDRFTPDVSGNWQFQAYWQGTEKNASAASSICNFTVESSKPEFTLGTITNCRSGPGTDYLVVDSGKIGEIFEVISRSQDANWLYGTIHGSKCWMYLPLGKLNVNPWTLPERIAPPLPVTPTSVSTSICSNYTNESGCRRRDDVCTWVSTSPLAGSGECVPK